MLKPGARVREGLSLAAAIASSLPCLAIFASLLLRVRNFPRSGWVSLSPVLQHVCACLGISELRPEAQRSPLSDLLTGGLRAKVASLLSNMRTSSWGLCGFNFRHSTGASEMGRSHGFA